MSLNISKCKVVRFTNKRLVIDASYHINDQRLELVNQIKDLGVIFQSDCKFTEHINVTGKRALRILGFINRTLTFINPTTYLTLYNSLVRSILEYATSIWSPYTYTLTNYLESIQRKFLRRLAFLNGTPMNRTDHDYTFIEQLF